MEMYDPGFKRIECMYTLSNTEFIDSTFSTVTINTENKIYQL